MATLKVFNLKKEEKGTVDIEESIASTKHHPDIIKDVVVYHLSKLRQGTHKTKERSEVKGSRKKLFRQKGTGNARVGSAQSPVRRHGGVVFGPVPRDHSIRLNKKVRKHALKSVIGEMIRRNQMFVVDSLDLFSHKTKNLAEIIEKWKFHKGKALFVSDVHIENFSLASRNLKYVKQIQLKNLNVYNLLLYRNLVVTQDALKGLEGRLLHEK